MDRTFRWRTVWHSFKYHFCGTLTTVLPLFCSADSYPPLTLSPSASAFFPGPFSGVRLLISHIVGLPIHHFKIELHHNVTGWNEIFFAEFEIAHHHSNTTEFARDAIIYYDSIIYSLQKTLQEMFSCSTICEIKVCTNRVFLVMYMSRFINT